jgi:hypothetical protein
MSEEVVHARGIRYQRGQAMSEFIVAMAVFAPLLLGLAYIGKYSDIKHQAIQASRYAAFERALDPSSGHESDAVIAEETRARFFMDGALNQGRLASTTASTATSATLNPLWGQMNGDPMLNNYSDIAVNLGAPQKVDSTYLAPVDLANGLYFGLNTNGQFQADVQVSPANIASFAPLSNVNLQFTASTVVVGDSWNAGGASSVASRLSGGSLPGGAIPVKAVPALDTIVNTVLLPFYEAFAGDTGPTLGCIRPDVVPANTAPGASYGPGDQCY